MHTWERKPAPHGDAHEVDKEWGACRAFPSRGSSAPARCTNCYQVLGRKCRVALLRPRGQRSAHSPLHHGGGKALHGEAQLHRHPLPDGVGPQAHQDLRGPAHPLQVRVPVPGQLVLHLSREASRGQCTVGSGRVTGERGSVPAGHTHAVRPPRQRHASPGAVEIPVPSPEWRICPACPGPVSAPSARFPPSRPAPGGNAPAWLLRKKPPGTGTCRGGEATLFPGPQRGVGAQTARAPHTQSPGAPQVGPTLGPRGSCPPSSRRVKRIRYKIGLLRPVSVDNEVPSTRPECPLVPQHRRARRRARPGPSCPLSPHTRTRGHKATDGLTEAWLSLGRRKGPKAVFRVRAASRRPCWDLGTRRRLLGLYFTRKRSSNSNGPTHGATDSSFKKDRFVPYVKPASATGGEEPDEPDTQAGALPAAQLPASGPSLAGMREASREDCPAPRPRESRHPVPDLPS